MADLRSYIWGASLAGDNLAAPANDVQIVGNFPFLFDGANWDRAPGTSADGALVNLGANNDVTVTGTVTVDSELPAAAALTDNFANPTAPAVGAFLMAWDGVTWDRAAGTAADGLLVNLGANNDVTVTGTVTVDSELPAAAVLTDNFANPTVPGVGAFLMIWARATWDRAPGTAADGLLVNLGANNDVTVSNTPPTTPASDYVTSAAIAAGAEANLDTADVGAQKLWGVTVWGSPAYRARVFTISNGVESTDAVAVGGGQTCQAWTWDPPHQDFAAVTATAGVDGFRVEFTNLDQENAADAHAVFNYAVN